MRSESSRAFLHPLQMSLEKKQDLLMHLPGRAYRCVIPDEDLNMRTRTLGKQAHVHTLGKQTQVNYTGCNMQQHKSGYESLHKPIHPPPRELREKTSTFLGTRLSLGRDVHTCCWVKWEPARESLTSSLSRNSGTGRGSGMRTRTNSTR